MRLALVQALVLGHPLGHWLVAAGRLVAVGRLLLVPLRPRHHLLVPHVDEHGY